MSSYFSVVPLTETLDQAGLWRLWRLACLDLYRLEWLRSFLSIDGERMLCRYEAPDAESVRFVLRQQRLTQATVSPMQATDAAPNLAAAAGDAYVAVEFRSEGTSHGDVRPPTRAAVVAALATAGHRLAQVFAAERGSHLVCLIEGHDERGVSAALRSAGLEPSAAWACIELDPRPPELFRPTEALARAPKTSSGAVSRGTSAAFGAPDQGAVAGDTYDAIIIGSGLSGICALERLERMGMRVCLYEAGRDVGGVWHFNRYPGARIDSESYTYGFSFRPELQREWQWSELFAAQPEVEGYLRFVVDRLDLRRHMRFETRIEAAHYDERTDRWWVETATGERASARYLIAATGALSAPQLPDYPGIEEFGGESHHTARWPAGGVHLEGRRVGVIGTGASGVQLIQTIAADVRKLTVFQRTPTYCIPQRNRPLTTAERARIERDFAGILAACRESFGGFIHDFDPTPGLTLSAEARERKFEALWQTPGFAFWLGNFGDLLMNDEVNAHACEFLRRKIRERVRDREVARKLTPDHPFGAKRVPLENGYYEAFNRDNVRLIDLRETPILRVTPTGVETTREAHPLDVLIHATGFDAGTGALSRIDIRGERGQRLADKWRQGPRTYLGLLVSGFPNLFIVNGPHNSAALCNAGRCIEQNVDWIARCIEHLRAHGLARIVPTPAAEEEWTQHVEDVADSTVLRRMKHSWFFGANTPGKPHRAAIYAAGARLYRERCEAVAGAGYIGCTMD